MNEELNNTLTENTDKKKGLIKLPYKRASIINYDEIRNKKEMFKEGQLYKQFFSHALCAGDIEAITILNKILAIEEVLKMEEIKQYSAKFIKNSSSSEQPEELLKFLKSLKIFEHKSFDNKNKKYVITKVSSNELDQEYNKILKSKEEKAKTKNLKEFKNNRADKWLIGLTDIRLTIEDTNNNKKLINFSKGVANSIKGFYANKNNISFFKKAIEDFKVFLEEYEKKDFIHNTCLDLLIDINQCFRTEDSLELDEYIIDEIRKISPYNEEMIVNLYLNFACASIRAEYWDHALANSQAAYAIVKDSGQNFSEELKLIAFYNLGNSLNHFDILKSLEYYKEAQRIDPEDLDTKRDIYQIYRQLGYNRNNNVYTHKEVRNSAIETLKDIKTSNEEEALLECIGNGPKLQPEVTEGYIKSKINSEELILGTTKYKLYNITLAKTNIKKGQYNEAFKLIQLIIKNAQNFSQSISVLKEIIQFCIVESQEANQQVLKFYQKLCKPKLYPKLKFHGNLSLKYYEFILYNENNEETLALNALKIIIDNSTLGNDVKCVAQNASTIYLLTQIEKGNYQTAKEFINKYSFIDFEISKYLPMIDWLQQQNAESEISVSQLAEDINEENLKLTSSLIDWADVPEEFSNIDPRAIHLWCQKKKKTLLEKKRGVEEDCSSWQIEKDISYISKHENVYQIKNNFYAAIDPKLVDKLEPTILKKFQNAIENGEVSRDKGQDGIKFIKNKLIELKLVGEDLRLYTSELYKNSDGKYLILFNKKGNHDCISKEISNSKSKIETIDVDFVQDITLPNVCELLEQTETPCTQNLTNLIEEMLSDVSILGEEINI